MDDETRVEPVHAHVHPGAERDAPGGQSYPGKMRTQMSDEAFDELCATIDPWKPCPSPPGSDEKMAYLSMRYHSGVRRLWNQQDATLADVPQVMDGFVIGNELDEDDCGDEEDGEW